MVGPKKTQCGKPSAGHLKVLDARVLWQLDEQKTLPRNPSRASLTASGNADSTNKCDSMHEATGG